jgi:hypothetical protein
MEMETTTTPRALPRAARSAIAEARGRVARAEMDDDEHNSILSAMHASTAPELASTAEKLAAARAKFMAERQAAEPGKWRVNDSGMIQRGRECWIDSWHWEDVPSISGYLIRQHIVEERRREEAEYLAQHPEDDWIPF